MKTLSFNTGRLYSSNGQPIVAARNKDGVVFFFDRGRLISGWITKRITKVGFTSSAVMTAYDANEYVMSPPDLMPYEDVNVQMDAAQNMLSAPLSTARAM